MRLTSDRVLLHGKLVPATVEIDGRFILSVTPGRSDTAEVDLGDRLVLPALVNAHTHCAMSAMRGMGGRGAQRGNVVEDLYFRVERRLTNDDIRAFARMGAWECVLSGTGAVFDHYYGGRAVAEAFADVGLCAAVAPTLQDIAGPGKDAWDDALQATVDIAEDRRLAEAGVVAALGPHATDTVSDALWARILDLADAVGLPVHLHVGQSLQEVERAAATHGTTPVGRLRAVGALDRDIRALLVHMLYVTDADLASLDPDRHLLVYCPRSQVQFAYPAPIAAWRRHGLTFAVATDAGVSNDTMNLQQELAWVAGGGAFTLPDGDAHAAFRTSGDLDAAHAVDAARLVRFDRDHDLSDPLTLLGTVARIPGSIHPGLPTGFLGPGFRANLIVVDLDHPAMWPASDPMRALVYSDLTAALYGVMVNGRWIGALGDPSAALRSDTYRDHRAEADERLAALLARL